MVAQSDEKGRRTVLITGGTGHVGRVVTRAFLREDYCVTIPWRSRDEWEELEEELPQDVKSRVLAVEADLTDEGRVRQLVEETRQKWGQIDCLLNLAGGAVFGPKIWETELDTWNQMMAVNLTTAFLCCKHVVPVMRRQNAGRIVNVSSKASRDIQPGAGAYAVAKGGVTTLTQVLREELKDTDITVNTILPSIIDTPVTREWISGGDPENWAQPEEIADVLLAICGNRCRSLSGSELKIYGDL